MPLPKMLALPNMAAKDASEADANASQAEASLLRVQKLAAQLLRGNEDLIASAERLAWLALWTRAFNTLDAARAVVWKDSVLGLMLLERSAVEAGMQLRTIVEPLLCEPPAETAANEVRARFRAFTAWALWSDRRVYQDLASEETADKVWDAEPARRLAGTEPVRRLFAKVFGEAEILNEHELEAERAKYVKHMQTVVNYLNDVLDDASITDWVAKLDKKAPRQFYELFDVTHSSVRARMRASGHDYFYAVYRQESHVSHGGTFEPFLIFRDGVAGPKLPREEEAVTRLAENVSNLVGTQIVDLTISKPLLWPRRPT